MRKKDLYCTDGGVYRLAPASAAISLSTHYKEAKHQEQMYDSLVQIVEDSETEPAEPIIYSEDKTILPELTELYRQNNDLVGWICVEDTNINYPVMQTVDNPNYYLKRGFDKEYSSYGCPYVQEDCDVPKTPRTI